MFSNLLLTPLFLTNQVFGQEYESFAGIIFDEQMDASGARSPSVRHSAQTRSMLHALVCGDDPNCPYEERDFFRAVKYYGCNCYSLKKTAIIDENKKWYHMDHQGAPIDAVDKACLDVANAYKCMFEDEQNGNLTQKPHKHTFDSNGEDLTCYEGQSFKYRIKEGGDIRCGPSNNKEYAKDDTNGCRLAACNIERAFAYTVAPFLQDPVEFRDLAKPSKYRMTPNASDWNDSRETNCKKSGGSHVQDSCCGEFPERFPYASSRSVCCDGTVSPIGSC